MDIIIGNFLGLHFGILFIGIILVLFYFINLNKLFGYLKNNYPTKYQELGEPSLLNMSSYRLLKFLGQSFQKEDANLRNIVKKTKILLFSVCIILAIGFINFFVFSECRLMFPNGLNFLY